MIFSQLTSVLTYRSLSLKVDSAFMHFHVHLLQFWCVRQAQGCVDGFRVSTLRWMVTILYSKWVDLGNIEPSSTGTPGAYVDAPIMWYGMAVRSPLDLIICF